MTMNHKLKTINPYFNDVYAGRKTFEVRIDDRKYKEGDTLTLQEYVNGQKTGAEITVSVDYILEGGQFGIDNGYIVMSIKPIGIY
jgi:ASC-1-like (ASCH) protein